MDELFQADESIYGSSTSASGPVASAEGRMGGGGWVDMPLPHGPMEGKGLWMAPIGDPGSPDVGPVGVGEMAGDSILNMVEGWDRSFMHPRFD